MIKVETSSPDINTLATQDMFVIDEDFLSEFAELFNPKAKDKLAKDEQLARHASRLN